MNINHSSFSDIFPGVKLAPSSEEGEEVLSYTLKSGIRANVDRSSAVKFLQKQGVLQASEDSSTPQILRAMKQYEESQLSSNSLSHRAASIGESILNKHKDPFSMDSIDQEGPDQDISSTPSIGASSSIYSHFSPQEKFSDIRLRRSPLQPPPPKELETKPGRISPNELTSSDQAEIDKISSEKIRLVDYLKSYRDSDQGLAKLKKIIPYLTHPDFRMTKEEIREERFQKLSQLMSLSTRAKEILSGAYRPPPQ